ncbi:MAG: T9SS type A sorting domain-containing protein [Saprospiraceae bacterium]|jgi:hypothetical protein|nr:T9SS type A sorting domain-containing protein [Saprospiraceae bacterium]
MKKIILLWLVVLTGSLFAQNTKTPEIVVPTIKGSDDYKATYYEEGKTYATEEWLETYMQYYHSNTDTSLHLLEPIDLFAQLRGKAEEQKTAQLYFDLRNTLVFKEGTRADVIENFLSETEATRPMSARKYQNDLTRAQLLFAGIVMPNDIEDESAVPVTVDWSGPIMTHVSFIRITDRTGRLIAEFSPRQGNLTYTMSDYDLALNHWEIGLRNGPTYKLTYKYDDPIMGPPVKRMKPPVKPTTPPTNPPTSPSPNLPELDEECLILPTYYNQPGTGQPYTATIEYANPEPYIAGSAYEVVEEIDLGNGQFQEIWANVTYSVPNPFTTSINRGVFGSYGQIRTAVYLNPFHSKIEKPIILTDGIDFLSNRDIKEIVKHIGGNEMISMLWDGGYDVIISDFAGGADFIQRNAFAYIELVRSLRNDQGVEAIEATIGPSMGGQIIRYALLYWENNLQAAYGEHNVKLFVSADSPWAGANASPALQVYADQTSSKNTTSALIKMSANAPAARQLLLHHTYAKVIGNEYLPDQHLFKTTFDEELNALGYKPQRVKKIISIADGSGSGSSTNVQPGGNIVNFNFVTCNPIYYSECEFSLKINGIGENVMIVDKNFNTLSGLGISCQTAFDRFPQIQCRTPKGNFDSSPGSPFNLEKYLVGFKKGTVVNEENGFKILFDEIEKVASFTFIPTFSALGMSPDHAFDNFFNQAIPNGSGFLLPGSPFDAVYFDNQDSEHNDLTNNQQPGSIPFLLEQLNYVPVYQTKCLILDQTGLGTQPIIFYVEQPENQNFCTPFELNSVSTLSSPGCGVEFLFNGTEIEIETNGDEEPCSTTLTYCMDVPGCGQVCNDVEIIVSPGSSNKPLGQTGAAATTTGLQELTSKMYMYPNPSSGHLNVDIYNEQDYGLVSIYNVYGRLVTTLRTQQKLDLSFLSNGVYSLVFKNKSYQKVFEQKLIIIK